MSVSSRVAVSALLAKLCVAVVLASVPADVPKADPLYPFVPAPDPRKSDPVPVVTGDPVKFRVGEWLIIDRADECSVLSFPPGLVTVEPIVLAAGEKERIRGLFAGGGGKVESRSFKGPYLYSLSPVKSGVVYVVAVPKKGFADPKDIQFQAFDVDAGTVPTPPVPSPPGPSPAPQPGPVKAMGKGGYVVVIEETADLAKERRLTFADPDLNAYMASQGHKFRIADKDVVKSLTDRTPPDDLVRFLKLSAGKSYPQVFLVDHGGDIVAQFDKPAGATEFLAKIKANGG